MVFFLLRIVLIIDNNFVQHNYYQYITLWSISIQYLYYLNHNSDNIILMSPYSINLDSIVL